MSSGQFGWTSTRTQEHVLAIAGCERYTKIMELDRAERSKKMCVSELSP